MTEPLKNLLYIARRFKLATALNLLGLIVAFAAFYVMMTQIVYQVTYNHGVEDSGRLYRIDTDFLSTNHIYSDNVFYPIAQVLDSLPEMESYSLMYHNNDDPVYAHYFELSLLTEDGKTLKFPYHSYCNKTVISTLTSKTLSGSIQWNFKDTFPDRPGVIISKSIAKQYFGKVDVAGDSLRIDPSRTEGGKTIYWLILGVYEDFPENSELSNGIYEVIRNDAIDYFRQNLSPNFKCIIKFKQVPGDVEALNNRLKQGIIDLIEKDGWENYADEADMPILKQAVNDMRIRLTPLKDSYFDTAKSISSGKHGFKPMFIILVLASLLLIIIAATHFLNFALVESPMRVRGINTRMVLGASRLSLQRGIITECVITSVIACVIALLLCSLLFSYSVTDRLLDGNITLRYHALLALFTLVVAAIAGIVAGFYPAIFVTSIVPAMALKGDYGLTPQGHKLRKASIAFQLFISFLMVIFLGFLIHEMRFIYNSPYHYNKDNVLISTIPIETDDSKKQVLFKELTAIPGVKNVSFSDGSLGLSDIHVSELIAVQGHKMNYDYTIVDSAYLRTMGIEVIEGRHFLPTDTAAAIINKSALQQWNWIKVGSKLPAESGEDSVTIVGVCEDIRYNTTRFFSDQPFIFFYEAVPMSTRNNLSISIDEQRDADKDAIVKKADDIIQKHLRDTTGVEIEEEKREILTSRFPTLLTSFDKRLEESYESEFRFFKWIFILSVICTLITLIGVFCLTMFETEYRRKEIGIRKVVGATSGEIVGMLCNQYIPLILISFAAAAPIALFFGNETLKYFAERTEIHWWIFPLALLIVGGVTLGTIVLQSWRTARENPVNSIKSE